jgi:hypothetical protein
LKSHNASYAVNLASASGINAAQVPMLKTFCFVIDALANFVPNKFLRQYQYF